MKTPRFPKRLHLNIHFLTLRLPD